MPELWITRSVEQSVKDPGYLGFVEYLETRLDYTVVFPFGTEWVFSGKEVDMNFVRRNFILSILKDGRPVEIEYDEHLAFCDLLAGFVAKFAEDPALGKANYGFFGKIANMLDLNLRASMSEYGRFNVTDALYRILTRPKFRSSNDPIDYL